MPRLATSDDFEGILRLAERKAYLSWPSQEPGESSVLQTLCQADSWDEEYQLFVTEQGSEISGFLLLQKQLVRVITHDRESLIRDCFVLHDSDFKSLVDAAVRSANEQKSQYVTGEVSSQDSDGQKRLEELGFQVESYKISVPSAMERLPSDTPYTVREVVEDDAFSIGILNSTMLAHTLTAGRDYDLSELTVRSLGATMEQVARNDSDSVGLALMLGSEMVGHLLLDLNPRRGYIIDLALAQEHWGGTAVRHLMRSGSRLLFERGIPLFVGDVSAANRRALIVAQRALGFKVDSQRYGLRLAD